MSSDFIFRGSTRELDPGLNDLMAAEDRRQQKKIILVASESIAPDAVREAMGSTLANVYAEGYPRPESRTQQEEEILDLEAQLAVYRRHGDPRYYKGVEFADVVEALARRRAAELFAANGVVADQLYVNVQPLSGSPANIAVYGALLEPGDTIMGLDLNHGGHLTHGSKISRSGKAYNAIPYTVDLETARLDYDALEAQAMEVRPKLIVAGYTAYPFLVDWARFRQIADHCGAHLMADIAHISGLVAAGVHPSPIGIADVVTTTTHKSLCGPRGAMIITHRGELSAKIDRIVFPGEQGGPHLNTMAAMAVAFKLARTEQFRDLMTRVVENSARLAQQLAGRGLRVVGGGSENHLLLIDTRSITAGGDTLSGDMAARILDVAGIVTNRNTIPGDKSAFNASGVRLGTVWISQLGFGPAEVDRLAEAIAIVLHGCTPFTYPAAGGKERARAKVDFGALEQARAIVAELTGVRPRSWSGDAIGIRGPEAGAFLNTALASDVAALAVGEAQATHVALPGEGFEGVLERAAADRYSLALSDRDGTGKVARWLADLSDGYVAFGDLHGKVPGPVVVEPAAMPKVAPVQTEGSPFADRKPFFIGAEGRPAAGESLPALEWREPADAPLRLTQLHDTHVGLGARMVPFGGWDMPVWYSSVVEEHEAVRTTAGLFDVSHMGVLEASGPNAAAFLNVLTTNDIDALEVGRSHYTYLLLPDGSVVDDLLIYRRGPEKFMLVVNASNNDKDWAWINAVNEGQVMIDRERPWAQVRQPAVLRDLRDLQWGDDCLVDIALQGPRSRDILLAMADDPALARRIKSLPWAGLTEGLLGGFQVVISRTGYTGERIASELFVHPDRSPAFWDRLMAAGAAFGLKPCGLASRDSTRTEAGLPLYGHELDGPLGLNPADAGFGSYVKFWKPFFIGRQATLAHEQERSGMVTRFRMNEKGVRRPEPGDPVLDRRGRVVGTVTSCAIDSEGYLLGQAFLPLALTEPGTPLAIYQLGGGQRPIKAPDKIVAGARLPMPDGATVLTRFPSRK
jgi:glycine hydroxymethyltransferase